MNATTNTIPAIKNDGVWRWPTTANETQNVDTDRLTYDLVNKTYLTDISDIGIKAHATICLVSHKTGVATSWQLNEVRRDREGELQAWQYIPTSRSIDRYPALAGRSLVIFND